MAEINQKISGATVVESAKHIIDKWRFRKYVDPKHISVVWFNRENTTVKLLDGRIEGMKLIIPSQDNASKMVNKTYILLTKKLVTKLCIVKEDINTTIDLTVTDMTKINEELFKTFTNLKLLNDLEGFNIGQVIMGGAIGTIFGFLICLVFMLLM